jgi:hypothetical protein
MAQSPKPKNTQQSINTSHDLILPFHIVTLRAVSILWFLTSISNIYTHQNVMASKMNEGASGNKDVKKITLIMKTKLEVLKMPLMIRQHPRPDSARLSEVCCIILSLDDLYKHLSFCNMTHPWNKGELSLNLRNNELISNFDNCELLFPGLHFNVNCNKPVQHDLVQQVPVEVTVLCVNKVID